ncbi:MAG TPA: hypothetical protein VFR03_19860 [Thermoanaerobaculia bacterium]|nr:hypothetical protein [Thermoanaerobaculia bacterium]
MPSPALAPASRVPWKRTVWTLVLVTIALALLAHALPPVRARLTVPTRAAEWIWESRHRLDLSPAAFYAVHDFDLAAVPSTARLLVTGDEEYILSLNGRRIGAGAWKAGESLDSYEVGPLLQPGTNRLLAEVRSGRGAGGFLLSLEDGDGRQLDWTNKDWRLFRNHYPGLVRGWLPLSGEGSPESEAAFSWGFPPVGSWRSPPVGTTRPLFFERIAGRPIPAATATEMASFRRSSREAKSRPENGPENGESTVKNPPRRLFDWGREVAGYVSLDVPASTQMQAGLLYTGSKAPPDPRRDEATVVLVLPGKRGWTSALPGRFRYALFVGIERPQAARVQPLSAPASGPEAFPFLLPGAGKPDLAGVFGIDPPTLRTPIENEIWGKLESVPSVAGRKKL